MYKGKKTLFYNGEKLWDGKHILYTEKEQKSWEAIIILSGVVVIPNGTFSCCENIETVIMSDTVKRIERHAFYNCKSLVYIKLSRNIEFIGRQAFKWCHSLPSLFIPSSCREIGRAVVDGCKKLVIFSFPQDAVLLSNHTIEGTPFIKAFPLPREVTETIKQAQDSCLERNPFQICREEVREWMKSINEGDEHKLHRICSSSNPQFDTIYAVVKEQGLVAMTTPNKAGITPLQYLARNPFTDIEEMSFLKRYIHKQMGE